MVVDGIASWEPRLRLATIRKKESENLMFESSGCGWKVSLDVMALPLPHGYRMALHV